MAGDKPCLAADALRRSEERFRHLAEMLPETIFEADIKARLTFVNQRAYKTFGYTRQDLERGISCHLLLAPEDRPRVYEDMVRIATGQPTKGIEYTALRKDGRTFPIIMYASPIIVGGVAVGFRGIVVDISDIKQTQRALQASEEQYRLVVENATEGLSVTFGGRFRFVNPKTEEILGYGAQQLSNMTYAQLVHPDDLPLLDKVAQSRQAMAPGARDGAHVCRVIKGDGATVWVEFSGVAIDWQGQPAWLNFLTDITARRTAHEEALLRARLQAAIETAGAACHELNQPLQSIILLAELTMTQLAPGDPLQTRLQKMREEMQRMADITHRLLGVTLYRSTDYLGSSRILDLSSATGRPADDPGKA